MHVHFVLNFPFFSFFRKLKNVLLLWGLCGRFTKVLIHTRDNAAIRGESNHNQMANTKYQLWNLYLRFPLNVQFHHAHTQLSLIHFNLFHFCCCMHWASQDASQLGVRPPLGRPQLCCWWLLPPAETPDCPACHLHTLPALAQLDLQQTAAAIDSPTRPTSVTQDICLPHTQQRS